MRGGRYYHGEKSTMLTRPFPTEQHAR
jgi:hypothetical protein